LFVCVNTFSDGFCKNTFIQNDSTFKDFDKLVMVLREKYRIPSVSIAIVYKERLVHVKSYGFVDMDSNKVAVVDNLYRIASVSKPITAIAVLNLVQHGSITLDQTVFGNKGILGNDFGIPPIGSDIDKITILNLLQHKTGWGKLPKYDNEMDNKERIINVITNIPLTTKPGTKSVYQNYGYIILAKVIEKVAGETYESYVKRNVLNPCGIYDMQIGKNSYQDRNTKEVKYYGDKGDPYKVNVIRATGAGGWIATATDLAKFIVRIDRNPVKKDLISEKLLKEMYFGNQVWVHTGAAPGVSAALCRFNNALSFVILMNKSNECDHVVKTLKNELLSIKSWPTIDLF
jgi:CubicO group peptidase (beta-lactamase class C family)